jgi:ApaG protein
MIHDISQGFIFDAYKNHEKPYISIDDNIEINIWPEFLDIKNNELDFIYVWAYHINIKNLTNHNLQLISRHFRIIDEKGKIIEVNGDGVVGEQPIFKPKQCFQYSSGIHLKTPSGIMSGYYKIKNLDTAEFLQADLPSFSLHLPNDNSLKN